MDTAEFKNNLLSFIQKYNGHSWQWVPNNFYADLIEVSQGNSFRPDYYISGLTGEASGLLAQQKELDIFFEIEKEISNAYFFWSWIPEIYRIQTFSRVCPKVS